MGQLAGLLLAQHGSQDHRGDSEGRSTFIFDLCHPEQIDGLPDHTKPLQELQHGFFSSGASGDHLATTDLDGSPPFSIRGYVAAVREVNIAKCWPFSKKLLEDSIKEGKHPLLPPLSPRARVVSLSSHYFEPAGLEHAGRDEEVCLTEGSQLQVQIDLGKYEAEFGGQGCTPIVDTSVSFESGPHPEQEKPSSGIQSAGVCPTTSQEVKAPSIKHEWMGSQTVTPFPENIFVFKRQAPRSIREIRKSIIEGCHCFKRTEISGCTQISASINCSLKMSVDNRLPLLNPSSTQVTVESGDPRKNQVAVRNVSESNPIDKTRQKECAYEETARINGLIKKKISDVDVSTIDNIASDSNLIEKVEDQVVNIKSSSTHKEFSMIEPDALEPEMQANTVSLALPPKRAGKLCEDMTSRTCISDSQSVEKSLEILRSESFNSMPCSDAITQQKCPVCLIFGSSSNTALNAHIDHCLASSDMEKSKPKWQKAKVKKKRSIAELCLIAPPCVLDECHDLNQNTLPSTTSKQDTPEKVDIKKQMSKPLALKRREITQGTCHQRRICKSRSKAEAFKLFRGSKLNHAASPSYARQTKGASKKMALHESRVKRVKKANSLGRPQNWNSKTMMRGMKSLKRKNDALVSVADQDPEQISQILVADFSGEVQGNPKTEKQKVPKFLRRGKGKGNTSLDEEALEDSTNCTGSELKKASRKPITKVYVKEKKNMSSSRSLKKQLPQKACNQDSHLMRPGHLITVPGSHDTTVEILERQANANANGQHDQGTTNAAKTHFCFHSKPATKSLSKSQHDNAGNFDDSSNLQLAIVQYPSVPQRDLNEEHGIGRAHSRETNFEGDIWLNYDASHQVPEMDAITLDKNLSFQPRLSDQAISSPNNVRRVVQEMSIQEPSLPTISSIFKGHYAEVRGGVETRNLDSSLTECHMPSLPNCTFPLSGNSLHSETLHYAKTPFRALNEVLQFPINHQNKEGLFLTNHSSEFTRQAWSPIQEAHRRVQVMDSQQSQDSPLLLSTLSDYNDVMGQQHDGFSLSLWRNTASQWPGTCQQRSLSMAGPEDMRPLIPVHLIKPLQITGLNKTSSMNQELTRPDILMPTAGRNDPQLLAFNTAETHQMNQGSTRLVSPQDHHSIQHSSFHAGPRVETRQAEAFSQSLPPWMQAAIKDQRSIPFAPVEMCPVNQSSVLGTTAPTNREMSGGSSVLDFGGKPVLRLMGKNMILTPGADQAQVDLGATHFNTQSSSRHVNFLQPVRHPEHRFEQPKQWNAGQQPVQAARQSGPVQNHVSGEPMIRNTEDQSWLSPVSCSQPRLRDLLSTAPSSSQTGRYTFSKQHASIQGSGNFPRSVSGQEVFSHSSLSRGTPLYTKKIPEAYMSWQNQKLKGQSFFQPHSNACFECCYTDSDRALCKGSRCNVYDSVLQQGHANAHNSTYTLLDVPNSMLQGPSWLSNGNRNDKIQQPAEVFIIDDDEDPIGSFDRPTPRFSEHELNIIPHLSRSMSAAQHPLQHPNARNIAMVAGNCNATRQNPKTKAFVPVIYTIGSKSAQSCFIPSSVAGPKFQELASEDCREVENYGAVINPKKRINSSQPPLARTGKFVKTGERGSPANFSSRDGSLCDLVLQGWGEPVANAKQRPPMQPLQAADEQLQGEESRGGICIPQAFSSRNTSLQPRGKDTTQCPTSLNSSKVSRIVPFSKDLCRPLVGICSTNMNPAEVDCQDAGQFMSMSCRSPSKMVPPQSGDSVLECTYINSSSSPSCLQSTVTLQEPGSCSGLPPVTMQELGPWSDLPQGILTETIQEPGPASGFSQAIQTSHQFIPEASEISPLQSISKEDEHLPVIYDSSKKRFPWFPVKYGPKSSDTHESNKSLLVEEGPLHAAAMSHAWVNPKNQPCLDGTTQSKGMQSLKLSDKFLILNGKVSMVEMGEQTVASGADGQYQGPQDHNLVSNGDQNIRTSVGHGIITITDSPDDVSTAAPNWCAIEEGLEIDSNGKTGAANQCSAVAKPLQLL